MSLVRKIGLLLALANVAIVFGQTPAVTPVPKVTGPIPVTADSSPFDAANRYQTPIDLAGHGYVEEEFFVSGTGNIYDWAKDGSVMVKAAGRPYTTRILLRRPASPARFSGTVIVELAHSALGFDFDSTLGFVNDYVFSHGDAYVAITVSSNTIGALKLYDMKRYVNLSFPSPVPNVCGAGGGGGGRGGGGGAAAANPKRPPQFFPPSDDSVQWDIISQVGALLKSNLPSKPLAGYDVQYLFATDHTAGETHTYARAFAKLATLENGKPVYDGFFIKEGAGPGPVNQCGGQIAQDDPRRQFKNIGVPVMFLVSQNYVTRFANVRREDSDVPGDQFRLYEVPGASHLDKWTFTYLPSIKDRDAVGGAAPGGIWPFEYACEPYQPLSDYFPENYVVHAMFYNLDQWVRKGISPPHGERVSLTNPGTPKVAVATDDNGNAVGGIRTPYVDVPAGTYVPQLTGSGACNQIGYWIPFSFAKMEALYGNYQNYEKKLLQGIDSLVQSRWLLQQDADDLKAEIRASVTKK